MKEKRISLRFRMDNDQDRKAWEMLEAVATERNTSKNAVAIDLILSGGVHTDSADELVERIAELVTNKLTKELICIPMGSGASGEAVSGIDGSPQESPGRATGLLIRSAKSNKELLLTRVTEPRRIRREPA